MFGQNIFMLKVFHAVMHLLETKFGLFGKIHDSGSIVQRRGNPALFAFVRTRETLVSAVSNV